MSPTRSASSAEILQGQREHLLPAMLHLYEEPLALASGQGLRVRDPEGREYMDLFSGILTTSVGHCNPHVVEAVSEQMRTLGHTSTLYATEPQNEAARRLADIAPGKLRRSFFTNSGTEAVETAVMMAYLATGRNEVVALRHAYHGRSFMTTSVTGQAGWRPFGTRVSGVSHTKAPYPYRCPYKQPCDESCADRLAADLDEVIATTTSGKPAAFIAETIQGVGGYVVTQKTYLKKAAEVIRSYGGLLIIDEVQAGFGRTGDHWFAIEHFDVEPDIMVMAKGIANGWPVGATITTDEIAHAWKALTLSTFGGNPVSMAALCATNDVMREANVPARTTVRGAQLRAGLSDIQQRHPWIGDVRGMGLMQALEIVKDPDGKEPDPQRVGRLLEACREQGVLLGRGGLWGNVVRIGPYLLITEAEVAEALERISAACDAVG